MALRWIGAALEMDSQRSTISLMHGNTGAWIVPPSHNVTATFSNINNFTEDCKYICIIHDNMLLTID